MVEEVIINHPGHNHPLRQSVCRNFSPKGYCICSGCNLVLYMKDMIYAFNCEEEGCEYYLHSWCARLGYMVDYYLDKIDHYYSDKIDHPLHPQHPLTLHFTTSYPPPPPPPPPPDNTNNNNGRQSQTTDHHQYFVCSFCKQKITSGFLLHCAPCDFNLDFYCARKFENKEHLLSQYEFQHFFHKKHTLLPHCYSSTSFSRSSYSRPSSSFCRACGILIGNGDLVLECRARGCGDYYLHVGCFRVPEEMKHPLHPQHTLTLVPRSIIQDGEEDEEEGQRLRCSACHNLMEEGAFVLNCNQCPLGSFALDMRCAFLNPTVKYDHHDHHLLAHYNHIDVQDALCAACNTPCLWNLYRCFACNFNIHKACLSLPIVVDYEDHVHPFTLVNSLNEDQSGTYYCDLCEEKREPNHGIYSCQECPSFIAHFECVLHPSYRKGNQPWMIRKFMQDRRIEDEAETPTLALTSNEKEVVSQLDVNIEKMGGMVKQLLKERHRTNVKPKMEKLEESYAEAEGMLRRLWELINAN